MLIKKSEVAKLFPKRDPASHKGENGRVLIIGGSLDYFGAPILSGLAGLNSGADLVTLLVPECNFDPSRSFYPDFIVRKYPGNSINTRTFDAALELLPKADCLLIGPGMSCDPESLRIVTRIMEKALCPIVLDAEAIAAIASHGLPHTSEVRFTITPHRGEMKQLTGVDPPPELSEMIRVVEEFSRRFASAILLKGVRDIIACPNQISRINETGNAGMTVGGSGDVLAGCVASFIAQKLDPYNACICAAYLVGAAGDSLRKQKGFQFMATDIALELPYTISGLITQ